MLDKIVFYNHYNTGDLFTARTFILELMGTGIAKEYAFSHHMDETLTNDFIEYTTLNSFCQDRAPIVWDGNTLYFNTWIGYSIGKYVLPGIVCRLDNFKRLYNDGLYSAGIDYRLTKADDEYIPSINQIGCDKVNVNTFIETRDKNRKLVLVSNGLVYSGQAENFDLNYVIYKLCLEHPEIDFIATQRFDFEYPNLFYTEDIIKKKTSDLKEIGYLSLFTNTIIGRSSGPFVYCQLKENYNDPSKTILSFTKVQGCAHMPLGRVNANLLWSKETNVSDVQRRIESVL